LSEDVGGNHVGSHLVAVTEIRTRSSLKDNDDNAKLLDVRHKASWTQVDP
jgi:hypothetical protein